MGVINLDHTGSGGGVTLSSDGSSLLLGGSAVGGGADLYSVNESSPSAQPSATGANAIAIGASAVSAGTESVALGNSYASGTDSIALGINNNTSSYGAGGNYSLAQGSSAKASFSNTVALHQGAHASGSGSTACGSYADAAGSNAVAIGSRADAAGGDSFCFGGNANADGEGSFVFGHRVKATEKGKHVYGFGQFAAQGDGQGGSFVLRSDTTDATAEAMTTNNNATADATNQIVAASDTCITFSGTIVAMQNGAQSYGSWEIRGLLVNDGGTTTLPVFNISEIGSSGWKVNLYADNTNNALKVQVTGEASHNIRWVANIQTSEVTYA